MLACERLAPSNRLRYHTSCDLYEGQVSRWHIASDTKIGQGL